VQKTVCDVCNDEIPTIDGVRQCDTIMAYKGTNTLAIDVCFKLNCGIIRDKKLLRFLHEPLRAYHT
jgi:hypothetical protein